MASLLRPNSAGIWLFCIALLLVRMSGAHWHLCLDGSEPPVSVHAGHVALDEGATSTAPHTDVDLTPLDDVFSKTVAKIIDLPTLLVFVIALCVLIRRPSSAPTHRLSFSPLSRYRLTARPRAPPL
jgi:hypothetical protein